MWFPKLSRLLYWFTCVGPFGSWLVPEQATMYQVIGVTSVESDPWRDTVHTTVIHCPVPLKAWQRINWIKQGVLNWGSIFYACCVLQMASGIWPDWGFDGLKKNMSTCRHTEKLLPGDLDSLIEKLKHSRNLACLQSAVEQGGRSVAYSWLKMHDFWCEQGGRLS